MSSGDDGLPAAVGEALSAEVLARRATLPRKPEEVVLVGPKFRLRPLALATDVAALHAASCGEPIELGDRRLETYDADAWIWRYMGAGPFATAADLEGWLRRQDEAADGRPLCVVDEATQRPVGVVNLMANQPEHLKVELGSIWYSPVLQGSGVSVEATWLLLRHAFALGYRRVEWKCDSRNLRSRRAALRMGFGFEGIQEAHYIIKGRNRDTAWFRMLERDWPRAEARLLGLLGPPLP